MIDTKALRSRVLDLAIQGKLTEQLAEDGNAEELYAEIQAEKQRLIKEGKAKKGKRQPEIMDEEIPFDIPQNWKFVTLLDITTDRTLNDGDWVLSTDMVSNGEVKLIQLGSIGDCTYINKGFKYLTKKHFEELNGKQIYPGYLLINRMVGDRLLECIIPEIDGILMTAVDVCWIAPNESAYHLKYIMYMLASGFFQKRVTELGYGTTRFRISKLNLIGIHFPFPPLAEQKRIVARVEEIFRLLDAIDAAQEQYSADAESLKAKLITAGIQGKLTEQLESDGTAEELYQQIQAEKQRLIKEGKIKREKSLPEIKPEEVPFEIPENWKWVRLKTVLLSASTGPFGSMLHKSDYAEKGVPLINPADIVNSEVSTQKIKKVAFQKAEEMQSYRLVKGNIVIGRRGEMGRAAIISEAEEGFLCGTGCFFITPSEGLYAPFFIRLLQTSVMREYLRQGSVGSTMDNLNHSILENLPIPLPPLAEQKRIAETLERALGAL